MDAAAGAEVLALDDAAGAEVLALDDAASAEVLALDGAAGSEVRHVDGGGLGFEGGGLVDWNVWFEVKAVRGCGSEVRKKREREGISTRYLYSEGRRKRWESGRGGCMVERGRAGG